MGEVSARGDGAARLMVVLTLLTFGNMVASHRCEKDVRATKSLQFQLMRTSFK